jgi:predicted rRNA methylase YqxC with S4 and FtsJ domains
MKSFEDFLISMQTEILACEKSTLMGEAGNQEWIYMIQKKPQK